MQEYPELPIATTEPPQPPAPVETHSTFIGPYGLRAGWSLLIFLLPIVLLRIAGRILMHYFPAAAANHSTGEAAEFGTAAFGEGLALAFFLFWSWIMSLIEHRRFGVYGLGSKEILPRFLPGFAWGLGLLSALVGLLWSSHLLVFDSLAIHGPIVLLWGAKWLFFFFIVGVLEEYLFRGYIQYTLMRGLIGLGRRISPNHSRGAAFWLAALITSTIFAYVHTNNPGETKLGIVAVCLAGLTFCIALWRTGSLWWAVGFHTAWDWAQSFLYGVSDSGTLVQGRLFTTHAVGNPLLSGGTVGPEGSVFVLPALTLALVVLFFTRPSPQPALELPHPAIQPQTPILGLEPPPDVS